jgi:probable HAF family extracellular repeat protein
MSHICKRCALALACLVLLVTGAGAAQSLVFSTIDFPGAVLTNAQGINAQGEIVGGYTDIAGQTHGFVLSGGQFRSIDFPNARVTFARGIGPGGDIVGTYVAQVETTNVPAHGFLLTNRGEFRRVDFPGHINTIPQRILPDGTILGCYHDTDTMGTMFGMSYSRGGWASIEEGMSMHNGATPDGKLIVGLFTDMDNRQKGYFIDRGRFVPFEVPGATQTAGWDINPAGVAVGVYRDGAGRFHGFQYRAGTFGAVDVPGATATRVFGINAHGDMVGAYVDSSGRTHGFLAQWVAAP